MSRKRIYIGKYLLLAALLLAVGICSTVWYFTQEKRDEVRIRELLSTLAADLSKNPDESAAVALLKVKAVTGAFADPMVLGMDNYAQGTFDREQLLANVTRYRTMLAKAQVSVDDVNIKITAPEHAGGYFSGKFTGTLKNGMSDRIIKDIDAEFVKIQGKWKIKSLKFTNVLH